MTRNRHYSLLAGHGVFRRVDSYGRADRLGLDIIYGDLGPGVGSMLGRADGVILVGDDLTEIEAHDHVTHQIEHYVRLPRRGESAEHFEARIRRHTARTLVTMDTFLAAVRADSASDDAEVDATAVADLLGVQVTTLLDRIQAPTRRELTASGSAASRLTWPSLTGSPYRCIRDCEHTPRLIDRIRHSLHLY